VTAPATTIFVSTIGDEPNFADCMEHLRAQTAQRPIEVIDRVAPMSAAFQHMLDRCTTPFYVQVDEDMALVADAVARLEDLMERSPANVAMVVAPLWDCETEQPIYGLKIYRHAIVRRFPYDDALGCESRQLERIRAAGYEARLLPLKGRRQCFGEHGRYYTPETIFRRWQRLFRKNETLGNRMWVEPWALKLLERYLESRDELRLYALLGAVAGIAGDSTQDREPDWREPNAAFIRLRKYFSPREKNAP